MSSKSFLNISATTSIQSIRKSPNLFSIIFEPIDLATHKFEATPGTTKKTTEVSTTKEVCAAAYAPYIQETVNPKMVVECDDQLNRALLAELKGLGG